MIQDTQSVTSNAQVRRVVYSLTGPKYISKVTEISCTDRLNREIIIYRCDTYKQGSPGEAVGASIITREIEYARNTAELMALSQ